MVLDKIIFAKVIKESRKNNRDKVEIKKGIKK